MQRAAVLFFLIAGLLMPATAAADGASDGVAIRTVIERQLAAFRRDDGPGAFAFASPSIRGKFGTPENFMAMVRHHYAPVYRPREVTFQRLRQETMQAVQEVLLVGPDGRPVLAYYFMERQADGSWKINGVRLLQAPDLTT